MTTPLRRPNPYKGWHQYREGAWELNVPPIPNKIGTGFHALAISLGGGGWWFSICCSVTELMCGEKNTLEEAVAFIEEIARCHQVHIKDYYCDLASFERE